MSLLIAPQKLVFHSKRRQQSNFRLSASKCFSPPQYRTTPQKKHTANISAWDDEQQRSIPSQATVLEETETNGKTVQQVLIKTPEPGQLPPRSVRKAEDSNTKKLPALSELVPDIDWQNEQMENLIQARSHKDKLLETKTIQNIAQAFQPYVKHAALIRWRKAGMLFKQDGLNEIQSAAQEGLMIAINRWKPNNQALSHFASIWIMNNCKQEIKKMNIRSVKIPPNVRTLSIQYRDALKEHGKEHAEKMLEQSRTRPETKRIIRELSENVNKETISLETPVGDENGYEFKDTLPSSESQPNQTLELRDILKKLGEAIESNLEERELIITALAFPGLITWQDEKAFTKTNGQTLFVKSKKLGECSLSVKEIAELFELTRERIRQLVENNIRPLLLEEIQTLGLPVPIFGSELF